MSRTTRRDSGTATTAGGSARAAHLGPAVRRPLVLDAALEVWDREGYRGTTMAAIASHAGVSKPVVYECFSSKDEVLRALLDREEERLMAATQAALSLPDAENFRATVVASFEAFFTAVLAHPVSWRIVVDAQRVMPPEIEDRYRRARNAFVDQIAALVGTLTGPDDLLNPAETHVLASSFASLAEDNASLLLRQTGTGADTWTPASLAAFVTRVALDRWG